MRIAGRFSLSITCCLLTVFMAGDVSAQGGRSIQEPPRGGVRQFEGHSPGVRQSAPGVREYGDQNPQAGLAYFGIMGAVSPGHAGTYSSSKGTVKLSELLESAQGLSENATGMAQIIRNGRSGMQVLPNSKADHQLLPGDLVVFQRDVRQEQAPDDQGGGVRVAAGTTSDAVEGTSDLVEVAFVGVLDRRPIVVSLDRSFATVADVVHAMNQPPSLASALRVIRTDIRAGFIEPGKLPQQLADGDVLAFDAGLLNQTGLSQAQEFPAAIPMSVGQPTGLLQDTQGHTAGMDMLRPGAVFPEYTLPSPPEPVPAEVPVTEPVRAFEETPLPAPDFPSADVEPNESAIPFAPVLGTVGDEIANEASVHQTSHDFEVASPEVVSVPTTPVPQIAVPELPATGRMREPAPTTALLEPLTPPARTPGEPEIEAAADVEVDFDSASIAHADVFVPVPRDPATSIRDVDKLSQLKSLNTASIALAVLVLAAMCFAVSVIWSRIDRTAQSLQQSFPLADISDDASHRRTLDRLIENNLPIIEERAPILKPSNYHGKEVGKRRLMIDQPHALAGPHFAARASTESGAEEGGSRGNRRILLDESAEVESRLERVVEHVRTFRRDERVDHHATGTEQQGVKAHEGTSIIPPRQEDRGSRTPLLDRVLVAMEREKRR